MNYYSQFGEDQWITENLDLPEHGTFLDVGAGDGEHFSNTYHFEQKGWKGLCIEANPLAFSKLMTRRSEPGICCAVGNEEGLTPFLLAPDTDLSRKVEGTASSQDYLTLVPIFRLQKILDEYPGFTTVDLFSLDVEGMELEVMESLRLLPTVIIIEYQTLGKPSNEQAVKEYFSKLPYKLVHQTEANLIYHFV